MNRNQYIGSILATPQTNYASTMGRSNMALAGSTLGGGMMSPLNLPAYEMGAALTSTPSNPWGAIAQQFAGKLLNNSLQQNQQSQRINPQVILNHIYGMLPGLQPGQRLGQQGKF